MTAVCPGGGASTLRTGVEGKVVYASGGAAIFGLATGWEWLQEIAVVLGLVSFDFTSLCTTDPPGFVTLTSADVFSLLAYGTIGGGVLTTLPDYQAAQAKVVQNLETIVWYQLCECTGVSMPTIPSAPAAPTGIPVITPGVAANAVKCSGPFFQGPDDLSATGSHVGSAIALPAGTAYAHFLLGNDDNYGTPRNPITFNIRWLNASSTQVRGDVYTVTNEIPGTNHTTVLELSGILPPATATQVRVDELTTVGTKSKAYEETTIYCGGAGPAFVGPCCQDSPGVLQALAEIQALVTLIQRQAAPFGYVYGANHTALTGTGSIAVTGLIGVSVDVTTLPGSYGTAAGTPPELFDVGYVTLGTADGYSTSRRIDHDGSLVLPAAAGAYTSVGYTLSPGVTVSIRELVREP